MEKVYLIQGIFFFENSGLDIGFDKKIGERAMIQKQPTYALFSGVISSCTDGSDKLGGIINDSFGDAELVDIIISDNAVSFTKRYLKGHGLIHYEFSKKAGDNIFQGKYKGKSHGKGICGLAKCILNVIDESFFLP